MYKPWISEDFHDNHIRQKVKMAAIVHEIVSKMNPGNQVFGCASVGSDTCEIITSDRRIYTLSQRESSPTGSENDEPQPKIQRGPDGL